MKVRIKNRKAQIIRVAEELFREKGFAATSMRDLAKKVGIEPASLYSHINSKEEILGLICFDIMEKFYVALDEVHMVDQSLDDCLEDLLTAHLRVILENIHGSAVVMNDWKFLNKENLQKFNSLKINYEWKFLDLIKRDIRKGNIRELDPKLVVQVILSSLNWVYDNPKLAKSKTAEELGKNIADILMYGLQKQA